MSEWATARARQTVLSELHVLEFWMPQLPEDKNCNLSCQHCYVSAGGLQEPVMSPREYLEALDCLVESPIFQKRVDVVFPGMEPLLPKNRVWFRALAERAVAHNLGSVGVTTNGTLLNKEQCEYLSDLAKKMNHPFTVNVSLDGTEKVHDQQRGAPGLWRKTTKGIERLSDTSSCNVVTNTTITSINRDLLPEIAHVSHDMGARIAAFHPFECANNSRLQVGDRDVVVERIMDLIEAFVRDEGLKHIVLEFEASNAVVFFALFERGVFRDWELIEDDAGFMFLRLLSGQRQILVSLMFYPHHFIRTMRMLHNGGFASCRSMALSGWKTVGNWRCRPEELEEACVPFLAMLWQEYFDSVQSVSPDTLRKFEEYILERR